MQTTSIIRNRGQLTIPESIRKYALWATPMSAVTISMIKPDEITIKPHTKTIDWDNIWKNIRKSRAIKSKGKAKAIDILISDRNSH